MAWPMHSSKSVDKKVWRHYIPGEWLFNSKIGICECDFICFLVFGQQCCDKQPMEPSNSAHTTRWRSLRPKKAFSSIEMEMNASGAMYCWLWQVMRVKINSRWTIHDDSMCFFQSAGAISSAIATPTDVLKVRMQVHGRGTDKIGLYGCFREIYQYEGISGLWRVSIEWILIAFWRPKKSILIYFENSTGIRTDSTKR